MTPSVEMPPPPPPAEVSPPSPPVDADTAASTPSSWSEQVGAAELTGELVDSSEILPEWAKPPLAVEASPPAADTLASPGFADTVDPLWSELVEASAAADALLAAPLDASYTSTVHPDQARVLDMIRPHWLQGEDSITHAVHALAFDQGMDYSAMEIDRALAWMLLQRRDMALHLRVWLVHRSGPDHDPRHVLEELQSYLLSIEDT